MKTKTHTPLPWRLYYNEITDKSAFGNDGSKPPVGTVSGKANGELIIRAVNCHAALLEACKAMLESYAPGAQETADKEGEQSLHSAVKSARAAIALARGQGL